jgi:hypothetical protein
MVFRRILAAAFLLLLVVEFGSHGVIFAHSGSSKNGDAVQSSERGHEDPCGTLIMCSDSRKRDQQVPGVSHDASQHNALFDRLSGMRNLSGIERDQPITFEDANALFRPPLPPFHPPKAS